MQVPNLANTILTFRHPPLLDCSAEPSHFYSGQLTRVRCPDRKRMSEGAGGVGRADLLCNETAKSND